MRQLDKYLWVEILKISTNKIASNGKRGPPGECVCVLRSDDVFYSSDLDLDPMTLVNKLRLNNSEDVPAYQK